MTDQRNYGMYEKFNVSRKDERDIPGGDREHARYFVLDLTYDPHSRDALEAYARSCMDDYPELANDLIWLIEAFDEVEYEFAEGEN